ncbi:TetR family transcriptional regulator [Stackebrandtia endophytica]|uniref:TetR family transcriptional regulator n=1 Tax=Stackebrandtia endophytica TaxID=1496996 RepID=A0A543AUG0_9ACTN|nr:TetR family transcriptional regulator [Stackebrandtia endophytica]
MTGGRTRRRGDELVRAIHDAALAEVAQVGVARLTMEGIARRAATAKTSLYRRWSSPLDLVLDALYHAHPVERPSPGTDRLRDDLIASLRQLLDWAVSPAGAATSAIMNDPQRDPEVVNNLFTRVFDARGGTFTGTVLRHYRDHGRIRPELVTPLVMDIGEAMVSKHLMDKGTVPTEAELADIVDQVILPAVGHGH